MDASKIPPIPQLLDGETLLITGGTGFVGKVLLEKILRCCPGVDRIYLIVRSKKGDSVKKRIADLLDNALFNRCRTERGDINWCCGTTAEAITERSGRRGPVVVGISGDLSEVGLGLSDEDRSALEAQVSVVFHSAATVKFNDPLRQATFLNTRGTREVLQLATKMTHLKAFLHVSTAYAHVSNHSGVMEERFYSVPMEPEELITAAEELGDEEFQTISDKLAKIYENTYLCTKALSERIIEKYYNHLPLSIYRPGIVTGIHNDPIPGWAEGTPGPQLVVYGCTSGLIGTLLVKPDIKLEMIPVDHVVNAMLSIAWETIVDRVRGSNGMNQEIKIYNHVSNVRSLVTTTAFRRVTNEVFARSTGKNCYGEMNFTQSAALYDIRSYTRVLFAKVVDAVERTRGKKSNVADMVQRVTKGIGTLLYFLNNEFAFSDARLLALLTRYSMIEDEDGSDIRGGKRRCFEFDMLKLDWDQYLKIHLEYLRTVMYEQNTSNVKPLLKYGQMLRLLERSVLVTGTALSCASLYLLSSSAYWLHLNYSEIHSGHT